MKIKTEIEIEIPDVPNHIQLKGTKDSVDIRNLSEEELGNIGSLWREALIMKARARRAERTGNTNTRI